RTSIPGQLRRTGHQGYLNPTWVEALMGLPVGWTETGWSGLDRHHWEQQWPALPGYEQEDWEPPRTISGKQSDRNHRLEALGNAVVPMQMLPLLQVIVEIERSAMNDETKTTSSWGRGATETD
ncbi:MAG: hypothetical protein M3Z24_04420, partial [Chloroflexota bacterium]|nr:hypothetical protein [Chloroflexota bacterium]